ncbi:uncharacterized protein JCM15063_000663 [Sporobolomyces koalae]|uniref:uncharacterized protein n=1 Tax=Sporobolomyces koalae TaxID=500713 RepID=UPI003179E332
MLTANQDKLFREAIRQARAEALAAVGDPIQLSSKPLDVQVRHEPGMEPEAWIAESGFVVKRIGLETGKTNQVYRGHGGPVTSLAFYTTRSRRRNLMISASWDKSFKVWDTRTKACLSTTVGHTDFIKTVSVIPELDVLVTGSSDKDLRVWDLSHLDDLENPSPNDAVPAPEPPRAGAAPPLAVAKNPLPLLISLKSHTRPIERLASFAITTSPINEGDDMGGKTGKIGLVSADSMGVLKIWQLERDAVNGSFAGVEQCSVKHHELAIYDLVLGPEGEMWTASADNSVLLSTFVPSSPATAPTPVLRIPHPGQTRALLSLPISVPPLQAPYLLTTSTGAEDLIRVFDLTDEVLDPDPKREVRREWKGLPGLHSGDAVPGCVREIEGHTNEIVQLAAYVVKNSELGTNEVWILSASLDGTLKRWKWTEMLEQQREKLVLVEVKPQEEASLLTEEEERELAELMGDDD